MGPRADDQRGGAGRGGEPPPRGSTPSLEQGAHVKQTLEPLLSRNQLISPLLEPSRDAHTAMQACLALCPAITCLYPILGSSPPGSSARLRSPEPSLSLVRSLRRAHPHPTGHGFHPASGEVQVLGQKRKGRWDDLTFVSMGF